MTSPSIDLARFDSEILALIPHRPPMLLINKLLSLSSQESSALTIIDEKSPFYQFKGVPSWIGLEYMGQTAALIAGYQLQQGLVSPHLGLLLGTRKYKTDVEYFKPDSELLIKCQQAALVGENLARFNCTIENNKTNQMLAQASLSVFRKPN